MARTAPENHRSYRCRARAGLSLRRVHRGRRRCHRGSGDRAILEAHRSPAQRSSPPHLRHGREGRVGDRARARAADGRSRRRPGSRDNHGRVRTAAIQSLTTPAMNSGPLSDLIYCGGPRRMHRTVRAFIISVELSLRSARSIRASLVNSSMMTRNRYGRPSCVRSWTKS